MGIFTFRIRKNIRYVFYGYNIQIQRKMVLFSFLIYYSSSCLSITAVNISSTGHVNSVGKCFGSLDLLEDYAMLL